MPSVSPSDHTGGMRLPAVTMHHVVQLSMELEAIAHEIERTVGQDLVDEQGVLTWHGRIAARMVASVDAAVSTLHVLRQEPGGDLFEPEEYFRAPRAIPVELEERYGISRLLDDPPADFSRLHVTPGDAVVPPDVVFESAVAEQAFWASLEHTKDD